MPSNTAIATTTLVSLLSIGGYYFWKWFTKPKYTITIKETNIESNDKDLIDINKVGNTLMHPSYNLKSEPTDMNRKPLVINNSDTSETESNDKTKFYAEVKFALETESVDSDKSSELYDDIPLVINNDD